MGSGRSATERSTAESRALAGRLRESMQRYSPGKDSSAMLEARRPDAAASRTPTGELSARTEPMLRDRIRERRTDSAIAARPTPSASGGAEQVRVAGSEIQDRRGLLTRLRDYGRHAGGPVKFDEGRYLGGRDQRHPPIIYRDRPDLVRYDTRSVYTYRDRYDRLCHRIIWPRFHYPIYYSYGPYFGFDYVYPYYHRKYVFVSLGGYWPVGYSDLRYYWYGHHPFTWYGYYPIPRESYGDNYSYYTYNYYMDQNGNYTDSAYYTDNTGSSALPYGIDAETYAKVQRRLAEQQAQEPSAQTRVDTLFDAGVKSFEAGNYVDAVTRLAEAMELAPDDVILPYAYAQALFAAGQYAQAAEVLRAALAKVSPSDEGVFYPRGLYPDDDTLFEQIEDLLDKVEDYSYDTDMQLLLGYNLLGIGETEYARGPLERAAQDSRNAKAAKVLLNLVKKLEAATVADGSAKVDTPNAVSTAPAEANAKAEANKRITDALDKAEASARAKAEAAPSATDSNDAGRALPVDIGGVTPAQPAETEPNTDPEDLGVGAGANGSSQMDLPVELGEPNRSSLAAVLIDRSATPAMLTLLGGAAFCLVRANKLFQRQV
ncbi:MAG: tetratricopeptide repeat protein [Sedimentisphaerales bacterium]|nr:tetratricopeptide repeat protein [Sedimentisphaerales bacterium]